MERATWRLIMIFFLFAVPFIPKPVTSISASGSGVGAEENATSAAPTSAVPTSTPPLTLLHFIFINSNNARFRSSGSLAAVDIALDMINRHKILHPYALHYKTPLDSQCNRTTALDVFYGAVEKKKDFTQYLGVIGSGCSIASIPVAEVSHYYNIPMISWTSAAAELKDRLRFRNYFRTVPSEESHSPGLAGLLRHLKWRQVAILTQLESLFISVERTVVTLLPEVDIVTRRFQTNDNPMLVPDLFVKDKDMRIFVLNMYVNHAKTILCQAYRLGMYYPRYLWITPGWYGYTWWEAELPSNCTKQDMERVLDYSLSAVQYPIVNESEISDLELSTDTFRLAYVQRVLTLGLIPDLTSPLAFDAVWSLAFALNRTMRKVAMGEEGGCVGLEGDLVPLENFTYHNKKMGCILKESIAETEFKGVTGIVKFAANGNRIGNTVRIAQYQSKSRLLGSMTTPLIAYATIGGKTEFDTDDELDIANITVQYQLNESIIWPEGVSPDGIPNNRTVVIELPLTVIYYVMSFAGIVFAVVCFFFNIIFRNKRVVRLTSPNLNYLVIAGAVLLYVSIFFWVTPADNKGIATTLCNLRIWFFSLGNTLCLAVVLSKMWRVYYIFMNPKPKRKPKPPQDWHLLIIVSVLVAVDFVILLIPTANPSSRLQGQLIDSKEHTNTEDSLGVRQEYSFYGCYNKTQYIWLIISYAYKFLLQLVAIYFAFMTRKVKVKALNDSKQIAAIIYITSLLLVISVFGFWIGLLYLNTSAAVFGVAQLLTATVFLGLVFIPKMIQLKLDPGGENIFSQNQFPTITNTGLGSVDTTKINELTKQVKELKEELEKYRGDGKERAYTLEVSTFQGPGRNGTVTSEDSLDSKPTKTPNTDTTHADSTTL